MHACMYVYVSVYASHTEAVVRAFASLELRLHTLGRENRERKPGPSHQEPDLTRFCLDEIWTTRADLLRLQAALLQNASERNL